MFKLEAKFQIEKMMKVNNERNERKIKIIIDFEYQFN